MKNKKGFFLAEAIVITSLVALTITLMYPQVANRYERMKSKLVYYNRAPDVYAADYIIENQSVLINSANFTLNGTNFTCYKDFGANYYRYELASINPNSYYLEQIIQSDSITNITNNYLTIDINLKKYLNSMESPTSGNIFIFVFNYGDNKRRYAILSRTENLSISFGTCTLE